MEENALRWLIIVVLVVLFVVIGVDLRQQDAETRRRNKAWCDIVLHGARTAQDSAAVVVRYTSCPVEE